MGYLKNKYTNEYFTGRDINQNILNYGVEGYDAFLEGKIRSIDLSILSKLNFKNKNVLEFGFGRGEAIKYGVEHGSKIYEAVDFSKNAINIADKYLKKYSIRDKVILHCDDATSFVKKYIENKKDNKFDIVIMFDFVEHVPRSELKELLIFLKKILNKKFVLVINTPNFRFDNDVINNGFDERNILDTNDTSDINDATKGMHCNKYSIISLQKFIIGCGYINITEQHFLININTKINQNRYKSYKENWDYCFKNKYPISKQYTDDQIETPYINNDLPSLKKFSKGIMKNISIYLTERYYIDVFPNGNYDKQLFCDFEKNTKHNEIIFDVGGFMGVDSLIFSKILGKKGKVITFEPNPYNLNRILINYSNNNLLSKKIFTYNTALSDRNGKSNFLLSNSIDNGFSSTSRLNGTHVEHTVEHLLDIGFTYEVVNTNTLDKFIDDNKIYPDIIKLDIEGAEHLFLLGASKYLKSNDVVLYIELHSQYCALICSEILSSLGYTSEILFEESDNRLLVKYSKTIKIKKMSINIDEIKYKILTSTINNLENQIKDKKYNLQKITKCINENISYKNVINENNLLIKDLRKKENYLIKILNNPIINLELKIFRLLKSIL